MRRILWVICVLALVWAVWWFWAASLVQRAADGWFEDRRAEGWQAEYGALDVSGFPFRFTAQMGVLALADPATGVAVTASGLNMAAPAWWPGDLTVTFPNDAITIASPRARATVLMHDAVAAVRLHPGPMLALETSGLTAGPWSVNGPGGQVVSAADLAVTMTQHTAPHTYQITAQATDLRPGAGPRATLRVPQNWPLTFDRFALDMEVQFDRAWDRRVIEDARPQPRHIRIDLAEAVWGQMALRTAAELSVDPQGVPTGTVSLQARNWQDILVLAESAGLLPAALVPQAQSALSMLAQASGDPRAIDATLTLRNGLVMIGFIPIGAAPRIYLR